MTDEEMKKDFEDFLQEHNIHYKPNPNKYPIIDKWNYKYKVVPNRQLIYNKIEELIDKRIKSLFQEEFKKILHIEE